MRFGGVQIDWFPPIIDRYNFTRSLVNASEDIALLD